MERILLYDMAEIIKNINYSRIGQERDGTQDRKEENLENGSGNLGEEERNRIEDAGILVKG